MMSATTISVQLPAEIYTKLAQLAAEEQVDPVAVVSRLVDLATQHRAWLRNLSALREQIERDGGLHIGASREEVVERMRQTRQDIFDAEYAHLYRSAESTSQSCRIPICASWRLPREHRDHP